MSDRECLLCSNSIEPPIQLFDIIKTDGLRDKIINLLHIDIDVKDLPKTVCEVCFWNLKTFIHFKGRVDERQRKLRQNRENAKKVNESINEKREHSSMGTVNDHDPYDYIKIAHEKEYNYKVDETPTMNMISPLYEEIDISDDGDTEVRPAISHKRKRKSYETINDDDDEWSNTDDTRGEDEYNEINETATANMKSPLYSENYISDDSDTEERHAVSHKHKQKSCSTETINEDDDDWSNTDDIRGEEENNEINKRTTENMESPLHSGGDDISGTEVTSTFSHQHKKKKRTKDKASKISKHDRRLSRKIGKINPSIVERRALPLEQTEAERNSPIITYERNSSDEF